MVINLKVTFLDTVDKDEFNSLVNKTSQNVEYFESVCMGIVQNYAGNLDELMKWIYKNIIQLDVPADDNILEKAFLELSGTIYFTYENLEHVGIYDHLSEAAYKEVYNNAYVNNIEKDGEKRNKKTVAELTSIAEQESQYESTLNDIYSVAYKMIKNKLDAAQTMLATISKIISKRMQESQISEVTTRRRLVEEY